MEISECKSRRLGNDIYESFDQAQVCDREQRQAFTGNLLRAFEQFPEGKLINFSDHKGQMHQGIITPKDFDIEKALQQQPVLMPTVEEAYQFLTQRAGQLKTADELLTVKPQRQGEGYLVQTPKQKDVAGRYYLDQQLLAALGSEFNSVGDRMQCHLDSDRLHSVLETIMDKWRLAAFEEQGVARKILGITLPSFEPIEPESLESKETTAISERTVTTLGHEALEASVSAQAAQNLLVQQSQHQTDLPTPPPSPLSENQEDSDQVKAQQQGEQVAAIIHNYLKNYLGRGSHQGQYHSAIFQPDSQELILIENTTEQVKLKAALNRSNQWHVHEFNLSERDIQHFQLVGDKVSQYLDNQQQKHILEAHQASQEQRVNTVANILQSYLTFLGKSEIQSAFHSVFWNPQNQTLTLTDNQTQENLMKAQWSDNTWKDLGSCLTQEKENYFQQQLLPRVKAHQHHQQQLQAQRQV